MTLPTRLLIDTDTASDDAVALVMALRHPDVKVEAITVVAGNVPVDQGVQNALYTAELCGAAVPVYRGADRPLVQPFITAQDTHGTDGMGDIGLPVSGRVPATGHAVDVIIDTINRSPGQITLVTIGPLTNIALALRRDPSLAEKVPRCVVMGGVSDAVGNVNAVAEYNIWADPEAAQIVLASGLPITMVGWDISRKYALVSAEEAAEIRALDTPLARFAMDIQRQVIAFSAERLSITGFDLPDPIAMAVAIDPSVAEMRRVYVAVELAGALTRGMTVIDYTGVTGQPPNADVAVSASHERFMHMLRQALAG
jgi:purine nucleosidase